MPRTEHSPSAIPEQAAARSARARRAILLHTSILVVASIGLYLRSLWNGFVYDDTLEVLRDPLIRSFRNIPVFFAHGAWYFSGAPAERYYRPLKLLAYTVEYRLFGLRPAYWHLVNVLLDLGVVLAIYVLVRDLAFGEAARGLAGDASESEAIAGLTAAEALALWTALFFLVHPVHVEAVAWVSAGNDLWCGLALLISIWLYHRGRSSRRSAWLYGVSVVAFLAGLLFKETALTFPAVLFAYDFLYRGESLRQVLSGWRRYAGYLIALSVYLAMRWNALGGFAPNNPDLHLSTREFVLSVPPLALKYVWKSLAPIHSRFWYEFRPVTALGWGFAGAGTLVLLMVAAAFWLRRRQPLLSFGLAWFWITLVPVLDIPKLGDSVFAERYLYIPSFGLCLLAGWAWDWVRRRAPSPVIRPLAYAGLAVLLALASAIVIWRIPDW